MAFKMSLERPALVAYVAKQIGNFFPDREILPGELERSIKTALDRCELGFARINNRYFNPGGETFFNHLVSDQYAIFLYYLSHALWKNEANVELASKCYYLNKSLHAFDAFYEVVLPDIFALVHPVGSVLGRGTYSDYFVCYQRVTIGSNPEGTYPRLGTGLVMYGGSSVIGDCQVEDNCLISNGTLLMNKNVPSGVVVFGQYPNISWKPTSKSVLERFFR